MMNIKKLKELTERAQQIANDLKQVEGNAYVSVWASGRIEAGKSQCETEPLQTINDDLATELCERIRDFLKWSMQKTADEIRELTKGETE